MIMESEDNDNMMETSMMIMVMALMMIMET